MNGMNPLPEWAEPHPTDGNAVVADPDKFYPAILTELGIDPATATVYWLEVAYQIAKMDLQVAMRRFNFIIHIRADDGRKDRWRYYGRSVRFPDAANEAHGSEDLRRATKKHEAREHFKRLRGYVPGA